MGEQLDIFTGKVDPRVPYVAGSETSKRAADGIRPQVQHDRGRVLAYLQAFGPCTDQELQDALDLDPSTERPRRVELVTAGLVYDSGRTRPTKSGRPAVLWIARKERP